jgi:hypothetical protein
MAYLSWKTDYSERQIQRLVKELVARAVLLVVAPAHAQRATEYRIVLEAAEAKGAFRGRGDATTPVTMSPVTFATPRGDILNGRGDIRDTRGDIRDTRGDIAMSPEPSVRTISIEPPIEPPVRARTRASPSLPFPDVFNVTKEMWQWAADKSMERDWIKRETEKFVAHWRSTGERKVNWTMTWYKWLMTAQDGIYQRRSRS